MTFQITSVILQNEAEAVLEAPFGGQNRVSGLRAKYTAPANNLTVMPHGSEETMLKRREEAVLLFLNELGHKYNGRVIPSVRSIATATNYSVRSVKYAIGELRANGIIQTRKRNTKRGMRACNQYFLTPAGDALLKELAISGAKKKESAISGANFAREVYKRNGFFEPSLPIKTMAKSEASEFKSCPFGQDCKDAVNALAHSDKSTCTVCFQTLTREKLYPLVGIGEDGPATPDEFAAEVYMRESKRRKTLRLIQELRDRANNEGS